MSTKHKLTVAMQQKLAAFIALERSGLGDDNVHCEVFSLQEELSYLARIETPTKAELNRLRAKFGLTESPMPPRPSARTVKTVPPVPLRRIAGAVLRLPAHAPQSFTPPQPQELKTKAPIPGLKKVDRARYAFERYCVHCDLLLIQEGPRYICPQGYAHAI